MSHGSTSGWFHHLPELLDAYSALVLSLVDGFYSGVSRYTTSSFLRITLGDAPTGTR